MNTSPTYNKSIVPLTDEAVAKLQDEDLVEVEGRLYCDEDLYSCCGCSTKTPYPGDLDDDGRCGTCAEEACAEAEHLRQLRADYQASVL